jgi:hypothetical protein
MESQMKNARVNNLTQPYVSNSIRSIAKQQMRSEEFIINVSSLYSLCYFRKI